MFSRSGYGNSNKSPLRNVVNNNNNNNNSNSNSNSNSNRGNRSSIRGNRNSNNRRDGSVNSSYPSFSGFDDTIGDEYTERSHNYNLGGRHVEVEDDYNNHHEDYNHNGNDEIDDDEDDTQDIEYKKYKNLYVNAKNAIKNSNTPKRVGINTVHSNTHNDTYTTNEDIRRQLKQYKRETKYLIDREHQEQRDYLNSFKNDNIRELTKFYQQNKKHDNILTIVSNDIIKIRQENERTKKELEKLCNKVENLELKDKRETIKYPNIDNQYKNFTNDEKYYKSRDVPSNYFSDIENKVIPHTYTTHTDNYINRDIDDSTINLLQKNFV